MTPGRGPHPGPCPRGPTRVLCGAVCPLGCAIALVEGTELESLAPPPRPRKSPASRHNLLEGLLGGQRWLPSKAWAGLASRDCVVVTRGGRSLPGGCAETRCRPGRGAGCTSPGRPNARDSRGPAAGAGGLAQGSPDASCLPAQPGYFTLITRSSSGWDVSLQIFM